jgi:pimeloyl-ACP methyl ester carboxylesterase
VGVEKGITSLAFKHSLWKLSTTKENIKENDMNDSANHSQNIKGVGNLPIKTLLSGQVSSQDFSTKKRPIVLLHGAWQGGWVWKKLTPHLVAGGHSVYTPTLTGLGDRAHLAYRDINLETHIQDVLAFLEMEDLSDVVLVGHSYAGFVMSAVAERAGKRLHSLVYLDAFVPENGKRMTDYLKPKEIREATIKAGQGSGFMTPIPLEALGVSNPEDLEWGTPRLVPQPFATLNQPIHLTLTDSKKRPHTYIACTNPATALFTQFADVVRGDPQWNFYELSTGHQAMMSTPLELSQILLEVSS